MRLLRKFRSGSGAERGANCFTSWSTEADSGNDSFGFTGRYRFDEAQVPSWKRILVFRSLASSHALLGCWLIKLILVLCLPAWDRCLFLSVQSASALSPLQDIYIAYLFILSSSLYYPTLLCIVYTQ